MKKETKFQRINRLTIEKFSDMFVKQMETNEYPDAKELFLAMHEERKKIIKDEEIKRDRKAAESNVYFMFQLAIAAARTPVYRGIKAENITRWIYNNMTLTALVPAPDVYIRDMRELIVKEQNKLNNFVS